jgi:sulfonate transport system substrate-binding protein
MNWRGRVRDLGFLLFLWTLVPWPAVAEEPVKLLRLDYAYYSPASLVLKHFGWVEAAFKPDGVEVSWVFSAGSNRALEYLNSRSVDFGSTAGLAAVLSRANGNPVKAVYVSSRPEWVALVVAHDSPLRTVADLRGRKVAATLGTDAYLFLLRALQESGLHKNDIEIVNLQHADGRAALEQGRVDAWAGLDPMMAASELESGSRLIYRNVRFNSFSVLDVSDSFEAEHPSYVRRVLEEYEKARKWILAHPDETAALLAAESHISLAVAKLQLSRND